jgi:hypothetical protein
LLTEISFVAEIIYPYSTIMIIYIKIELTNATNPKFSKPIVFTIYEKVTNGKT